MQSTFKQAAKDFHNEIAKYFPERADEMELLFAINSSFIIKDISQPIALFLLGPPSSGKTTCLELLKSLPNIIWRDNITPAALVSGVRDMDPEDMLLYQLPDHTLIVPEFAPLSQNANAKQIMADFTRLLDSNGMVRHTGNGPVGFTRAMKFNMLGATVRFSTKTWELMSTIGPRLLFLRLQNSEKSVSDISKQLTQISKDRNYAEKLDIGKKIVVAFYEKISKMYPAGIGIHPEKDCNTTMLRIANLSQLLSALRGIVIKNGRDFTSEKIIEDPKRVYTTLVGIARCLALVRGRSFITKEELPMISRLIFDSAEPIRVQIIRNIIKNGSISTNEFVEISGLSRSTTYRKFLEICLLGICKFSKKPSKTKPSSTLILSSDWHWLLQS